MECVICKDAMRSAEYSFEPAYEGDIRMPCRHALHAACAAQWWLTAQSIQCPVCLHTVVSNNWTTERYHHAMMRIEQQQTEVAALRRALRTFEGRQKFKTSVNVFNVVCALVLGFYSSPDSMSVFLLSHAICFSIMYDDAGYATPFLYAILWLRYGTPVVLEIAIRYMTVSTLLLFCASALTCMCRR